MRKGWKGSKLPQLVATLISGSAVGYAATGTLTGTGLGVIIALVGVPLTEYWLS